MSRARTFERIPETPLHPPRCPEPPIPAGARRRRLGRARRVLEVDAPGEADETTPARGPWSLRDLLDLDPTRHAWVSRRWVVLGDPGAGKTTMLRHLAASVARQTPPSWVPVFESLSRLLREPEWLLDRLARQMRRAGQSAEGFCGVAVH